MNTQPVVATRGLSKFYNHVCRVNNINLEVLEGEIYGFLGPNGAGKSTTLKMLLGLAKPTDGRITLFGQELGKHRRAILNQIGSLIESPSYYGHLTGLENQKNKQVEHYSLGMKQRLGIAKALISYPKLLILDEPTNGLDPAGIGEIRELIKSLPWQYGITVLLSSHLLSEIEQIATSVGIISDGNLLYQGKMETLQERNRSSLAIRTSNNTAAAAWMQNQGYMACLRDECLQIEHMSDQQVARRNKELVLSGINVLRIEERKRTLEDIFLELTGRERSL
ncbi:ABC transporter ATP-binding protein [Paenibacillus alvei]|uniref:ABC transporter ATP-binding protein n=1 Tax=Paenibacillus alvei TaxID=44250 RepID=UPI0013DAFEFE|nr:ABC transporter ATP-binding protein [Paenibacillus alvei]NEZ40642.1 ATP-binding cassette domain-containing protein [Paenibacillus alvei]